MSRCKGLTVFLFFLLCLVHLGWDWGDFSIKITAHPPIKLRGQWTVDTIGEGSLRLKVAHNIPPLIAEDIVIQGNLINGIKAYTKDKGKLLWSVEIKPGVASPLLLHKRSLYFGGADGFFYSLQLETGLLNWKFFTGSENAGAPFIYEDKIYWTANNQKIYAFSLKGERLWIYSGDVPLEEFVIRGRPRPSAYKNLVYAAFYPGRLVALDRNTGKLKWEREISTSHPIKEDLGVSGKCLFVPVFDFHLFCLNPSDGKVIWKARGGSSSSLARGSVIYQSYKEALYALEKTNGKLIWRKTVKSAALSLPPVVFKDYLIYGFPSKGKLIFASAKNGKTLTEYKFGKGLAGPVRLDEKNRDIYFFSVDGYLHKVSIL